MFPGETILEGEDFGEGKEKVAKRDAHLSDLQVMHSAAGFYIGTIWTACGAETCSWGCAEDYGWLPVEERVKVQEPGSRESGYFPDKASAEQALETFKETGAMARLRE
jgi:hypothetical protein